MIELLSKLLISILWDEVKDHVPSLIQRILKNVVRTLPEDERDRMAEEWKAEIASRPGRFRPLYFACSLWWGMSKARLFSATDLLLAQTFVRTFDLYFSVVLGMIYLPLGLLCWVFSALSAGTFALEKILLVGKGGKVFAAYRFQVMNIHTGHWTAIGRLLSKYRLDRLPFLVSMIRGQMSAFGTSLLAVEPAPPGEGVPMPQLAIKPGYISLPKDIRLDLEKSAASLSGTMRVHGLVFKQAFESMLEV
jgi:hypothetical protein